MRHRESYDRLAAERLLIRPRPSLQKRTIQNSTSRHIQQKKLLNIPSAVHTFCKTINAAQMKGERDIKRGREGKRHKDRWREIRSIISRSLKDAVAAAAVLSSS